MIHALPDWPFSNFSSESETSSRTECAVGESDAFDAPGPPYRLDRVEEICSALKLKKEAYSFPENDMEANVFRDKRLKKLVPRGDVETCEKVLNQVFAEKVGITHYQLK